MAIAPQAGSHVIPSSPSPWRSLSSGVVGAGAALSLGAGEALATALSTGAALAGGSGAALIVALGTAGAEAAVSTAVTALGSVPGGGFSERRPNARTTRT